MPFSATDLLFGIAIPAITAGITFFVLGRLIPSDVAKRSAAALALAAGFCCGYWLLSLGPWQPVSHWHWLPYAVLMTVAVGPVSSIDGVSWIERAGLFLVAAIVCAWLLVPDWPDLNPSRQKHLAAWVVYVVGLAMLLAPLNGRLPATLVASILSATLFCAGIILAISGSLRFAQMGIAGAAAMAGVAIATVRSEQSVSLRGISMTFSVLSAGALLVGQVNSFSEVPRASYALAPMAPLLLWAGVYGPLARRSSWKQWLALSALPITVLFIAVALAAAFEFGSSGAGDG